MKESCENFAELLVDYADDCLSAEQSSMVADHLSECDHCRTVLNGLHRSLELAEVIWEDNLSQTTETIRIPAPARMRRRSWPRYAAAVILIVSAIFITSHITNRPAKSEPTLAEMERRITEAGNAARLLAAADLLGGYSEAETIARQQYRRIAETYPDTSAASRAKLQIE